MQETNLSERVLVETETNQPALDRERCDQNMDLLLKAFKAYLEARTSRTQDRPGSAPRRG